MFKKFFKNMNQEHTENSEKEIIENEVSVEQNQENTEIPPVEMTKEEKLEEELAKEKDKFLRLFAEFENFKKRTAKERIDLFKTANQEVLQAMLPVLDDFDRALVQISKNDTTEEQVLLS
jgi:molecular chaperone GrpE